MPLASFTTNRVNILFVNYGDFTSNSLNHIGAFANSLTLLGHACVVAVPDHPETISVVHAPLFTPVTFARALESAPIFPDRRPADLVHAWTPRENVRAFTLAYVRAHPTAALVIHLEDNEEFLIASYAQKTIAELRRLSDEELTAQLSPRLSHPIRYRNFLRVAHAATVITDRLREFVPPDKPTLRLLPGIDGSLYQPLIPDPALRDEIGLKPGEKVLVYTGSTTFANLADVRTLLLAVRLINDRGTPCKLVRTGINPPELAREIAALGADHVIDLGFVAKEKLAALLSLADALVQPGAAGDFNDYRLPSKLPEFLCVGRPVIAPRANLAREMEDGRHALLLDTGTAEEIADKCLQVFGDEALAQRLADGGLEFGRAHFDLKANIAGLLAFYEKIQANAAPIFTDPETPPSEDVLLADGDAALRMRAKELTIATQLARLARLESEVATAAREKTLSLAQASYQHASLQAARNQVEVLRGLLDEATRAMGKLTRDFETEKVRADQSTAELHLRDDKLKRMIGSFSWQATGPLRSLRRLLVDPYKKNSPVRAAQPTPACDPALAYVFDQPETWDDLPPAGTIRGWVLHRPQGGEKPAALTAVRVRTNDASFEATYRLLRPDVAACHVGHPHALHSGFTIDYSLPPDHARTLIFEALTQDGQWHCFATPATRVAADIPEDQRRDYRSWVRRFDSPTIEQIVTLRAHIESLQPSQRPLISVLLPTYNTPERWLARAIESVRAQTYPYWELCIADDASTADHVRLVLEDYVRRDGRIKVTFRKENGHISAASNSALALATGEFISLLDHDDELAPTALAEVVSLLARAPGTDLVYSDEDKIDEHGVRYAPYFKPDFLPDLLTGQNYLSHLTTIRASQVREVGGFRAGYEGSQDWDLFLRVVEHSAPERIRHIPKVLYHWRSVQGSTARGATEKNYAEEAAERALGDHFERLGLKVSLEAVPGHHWRVVYPLPAQPPLVSIVIPTKNQQHLLRICIGSIFAKTTYPAFEIVVVNNRSDDPATLAYFQEVAALNVRVVDYDAPFNYSAINNFAVRHTRGEVLCLLNNDIEVISPAWLEEMVSQARRPEIGAVGAMLYYPNDTVQHAGCVLGIGGVANHAFLGLPRGAHGYMNRARLTQNYSAVTAACLAIRRSVYEQVGGFDAEHLAVAFNDIDFCLRVREAGYRNLWTPFAEFYHRESATRGYEDTPEKVARFNSEVAYMMSRWGELLRNDPAYNPNLSLQHEDFSLAFPPR